MQAAFRFRSWPIKRCHLFLRILDLATQQEVAATGGFSHSGTSHSYASRLLTSYCHFVFDSPYRASLGVFPTNSSNCLNKVPVHEAASPHFRFWLGPITSTYCRASLDINSPHLLCPPMFCSPKFNQSYFYFGSKPALSKLLLSLHPWSNGNAVPLRSNGFR